MTKYQDRMIDTLKSVTPKDEFILSSPIKISTKNRNAFSIAAGPNFSCPGATKACLGCYAQKGRHVWPAVQNVLASNWINMKKFEKANDIDSASKSILNHLNSKLDIFRIYESGDFHSQWAIELWANIVKKRKDLKFWAYTRSFHLNFTSLTRSPNFSLWASTDKYNIDEAKKFVRRFRKSGTKHAFGPWDHNDALPDNSVVCPATNGTMDISGACESCMLCVVKKRINKNIIFLAH